MCDKPALDWARCDKAMNKIVLYSNFYLSEIGFTLSGGGHEFFPSFVKGGHFVVDMSLSVREGSQQTGRLVSNQRRKEKMLSLFERGEIQWKEGLVLLIVKWNEWVRQINTKTQA